VVETHLVGVAAGGGVVEGGGVVAGGAGDALGDVEVDEAEGDWTTHLHLVQQSCFGLLPGPLGSMTEHSTEIVSQKPSHCLSLEMSAHPSR